MKLNEITTRQELATILGIPLKKLTYVLYHLHPNSLYKTFQIPKSNGGFRTIHAPIDDLKEIQTRLASVLYTYFDSYKQEYHICSNIAHAFTKEKNIITNASIHQNKRFIYNIDLKDYFEHFHFGRIRGFFHKNKFFSLPLDIATILAQLTCYNGTLPQGAPTSPIITNLICNILDMRIIKIAKKYGLNYSRYADDMTFSTNRKDFITNYMSFHQGLEKEIFNFGFEINPNKIRLLFSSTRQEVTGLTVNKKINISRTYYKLTRAMANSLYTTGEFQINGSTGTIAQLEGRFSFIDQIDQYNNKIAIDFYREKPHKPYTLNTHEKDYQKFLYYKYFFSNTCPLIITEGKTDIIYLKAALKKYYSEYPSLISKDDKGFHYKIDFLKRTKRLAYFLGIFTDGADAMKNIYNIYCGDKQFPALEQFFRDKTNKVQNHPVILIFDNEQISKKPLREFLSHVKIKEPLQANKPRNIATNLFVSTIPLINEKNECEMEDLFNTNTLNHMINGKKFNKKDDFDNSKYYGKAIFANYISSNYQSIDFSQFKPILDMLSNTISNYYKLLEP